MNKELCKTIMTRTRVLNKVRKFNDPENQLAYKRQRNYCFKLLKRSKKDFFNNPNVERVTNTTHIFGKPLSLTLLIKFSRMKK